MEIIIFKVLPILCIFFLGLLLKHLQILKKDDGDILLKLVFYLAAPALIFISMVTIELDPRYFLLPLISASIILCSFALAYITSKFLNYPRQTIGTFLIGSSIINTGFVFPFLFSVYAEEAVVITSFFDIGSAFVVFGFLYYIACKYGGKGSDASYAIKKILISPPLWALILGLICNLLNYRVDPFVTNFFQLLGNLLIPLTMLALGIYFSFKIKHLKLLTIVLFFRMFVGVIIGTFLSSLFGLTGLMQTMVIILSAAPVGYNTVTFASLENLDKEFATSILSIAILIGLILTPLMIFLMS